MRFPKLGAVTIGYSFLILVWFISWLWVGDTNWWLVLINRLVPFIFIPVLPLAVWMVFTRRLRLIILLLTPFFIFLNLYHPYLLPKFAKSTAITNSLKVMTYNVLFSNYDYDAVANVILTYKPDLVALQEVQPEMMSGLEERLGDEYPYSLIGAQTDYGTTAVFSHHQIIESAVLDLQADRPAVLVKIKAHNQEFTFVAVHLLAYNLWWTTPKDIPATVLERTSKQNRQVELVVGRLKEEDGTVIIGCDCNSYETSSSYRIFDEWLDNSARDVGWVLGEDTLIGTKRDTYVQHIDYIWYRGTIEPVSVFKIVDSGGSDHLPVLALFSMK
jgi:endonuclease/exonuclease/phosphatase (EEP) superfamily protein YafD